MEMSTDQSPNISISTSIEKAALNVFDYFHPSGLSRIHFVCERNLLVIADRKKGQLCESCQLSCRQIQMRTMIRMNWREDILPASGVGASRKS